MKLINVYSIRLATPSHLRKFPIELYKRFINGPNFSPFLENASKNQRLKRIEIRKSLLIQTDMKLFLSNYPIEVKEETRRSLIAQLTDELRRSEQTIDEVSVLKMKEHLAVLIEFNNNNNNQ